MPNIPTDVIVSTARNLLSEAFPDASIIVGAGWSTEHKPVLYMQVLSSGQVFKAYELMTFSQSHDVAHARKIANDLINDIRRQQHESQNDAG